MSETLNERIKKLRKEKGLTQLKLANQLNITDKAVSKWEVGEGNPDISILPKLSEIFGVSVDYILTGRNPEDNKALEDMDALKRAKYLTNKDDLTNFIKYGYNKHNSLLNPYKNSLKLNPSFTKIENTIRNEIYKSKSKKIFNYLLDDLMKDKKYVQYYKRSRGPKSASALVYSDIDNYIKMCAISNRVDGLKFIDFEMLAIGDKSNQTFYTNDYQTDPMQRYLIQKNTLDFIFEDTQVSPEIIDYLGTLHQGMQDTKYWLNDYILYCMYHYEKFDLLNNVFNGLNTYLDKAINQYTNIVDGFIGRDQVLQKHNTDDQYTYYSLGICSRNSQSITHFVEPIKMPLDEAIKKLDIEWIVKFNEYNRKIALNLSKSQGFLNEKEIKRLKMQADPDISEDEILVFNYTKNELLNIRSLLDSLLPKNDNLAALKNAKRIAKRIYGNFVSKAYINYCEMIEKLLSKNDYKKIFEFSVNNKLSEISELLINREYDSIMAKTIKLFYLGPKITTEPRNARYIKQSKNIDNTMIELLLKENPHLKKNLEYKNCLLNQYKCYNLEEENVDSFVETCSLVKKDIYKSFVSKVDEKIEKLTGERKSKLEYESICNELTEDYIRTLISTNQLETAVIKLCVKLEAKLKYIFKYEGDFKTMVDMYIDNNLKLENLWDDEDNNYYHSREQDAQKSDITKLLNRLRMVRNGIVHSTTKEKMITTDELNKIVDVIEKI
jgi:transcriptional regulator with XRE-family HTH domain